MRTSIERNLTDDEKKVQRYLYILCRDLYSHFTIYCKSTRHLFYFFFAVVFNKRKAHRINYGRIAASFVGFESYLATVLATLLDMKSEGYIPF